MVHPIFFIDAIVFYKHYIKPSAPTGGKRVVWLNIYKYGDKKDKNYLGSKR